MSSGGVSQPPEVDWVRHPERRLEPRAHGGFELIDAEGETIAVLAQGEIWRVRATGALDGALLRRTSSSVAGFELLADRPRRELGRTTGLGSAGCESLSRFILLDDGRLFALALRGPNDARFEVLGWESPGAYLIARPADEGWTITPTPACAGLVEIRPLTVLLAAELLDSVVENRAERG